MSKRWLCGLSLLVLAGIHSPSHAGPLPFADMLPRAAASRPDLGTANMETHWGYGERENRYNELIVQAVSASWSNPDNPLPPLLYKSLMAVESSFNAGAVSSAGAAGLAQLMPDTARRFGLALKDRLDPWKALPAGIAALEEKHRVILDPGHYYDLVGMPGKPCPWGDKVAALYAELGPPEGDQLWCLVLGAYNGGGGTILRAMAYARDAGLDARQWDQLAGPPGQCLNTPLHKACSEVFGERNGAAKARELSAYPRKIMSLYKLGG